MSQTESGGRITILVVEDDPELQEMICLALRLRFGYHVLTAQNGQAGVLEAETEQPDLVVMDLAMPVMDGIAATRLLKGHKATQHIPVIAYSNYALREKQYQMALNAGCVGCLSKSSSHQDLNQMITEVLHM